jgi:hypothetical protein
MYKIQTKEAKTKTGELTTRRHWETTECSEKKKANV